VLGGLKLVQFRKALETVIVQALKTPTNAEGAPALKPHEALIVGCVAIAAMVAAERLGLGQLLAGLMQGVPNDNANTNPGDGGGAGLAGRAVAAEEFEFNVE
jgi:hypothetical protein